MQSEEIFQTIPRDANLWRPKNGRLSFFHYPPRISMTPQSQPPPSPQHPTPPPPRQIDPAPNGNDLGHYNINDVLHDVHSIKILNHRSDARN